MGTIAGIILLSTFIALLVAIPTINWRRRSRMSVAEREMEARDTRDASRIW